MNAHSIYFAKIVIGSGRKLNIDKEEEKQVNGSVAYGDTPGELEAGSPSPVSRSEEPVIKESGRKHYQHLLGPTGKTAK